MNALGKTSKENKPKMAYSRDLPKMAVWHVALWIKIAVILYWRQRLKIWYDLVWFDIVWYGFVGKIWYGGGQMTSEFIHEEISIMDYNGLS